MEQIVLLTTPPERASALARTIVERKLAACVNIVPSIQSIYWWEGKICEDDEALLIVKTASHRLLELESAVKDLHPYETPEFVVIEPTYIEDRYRAWIKQSLESV